MDNWILHLDYKILELINQTSATAWQDQFFPWITDLNKSKYFSWIIIPLLLFLFYKKFKRMGISFFLILLLAMSFNDFVGGKIKNYYQRPRPFQNLEIPVTQKSPADSKSFYSNHTSNSFTFATYTSIFFPAAEIPLFVLASIVGYSRIYNGVHYPSDVLAGALMGIIWGYLFSYLAQRFFKKHTRDKK